MATSTAGLRHDPGQQRYAYVSDGETIAVLDYRRDGDTLVLHHTFTEPHHRGHGYAARLVEFALDDLRTHGQRLVPQCSFVAEFVAAHPEYRDLIADP